LKFLSKLIFVLGFICGGVNAQDWSFDDLRNLDSKEAFIQKVNEKGFLFDFEDDDMLLYYEDKAQMILARYQTKTVYDGVRGYEGDWALSFYKSELYLNIYTDVQKQCEFSDVSDFVSLDFTGEKTLKNVVFYSCPNSTYRGKIGFVRNDETGIIVHRSKVYREERYKRMDEINPLK
jgi:hypothetical protein